MNHSEKPRVTGLGGVFFKAKDPKALKTWYTEHLGLTPDADGYITFQWRDHADPEQPGTTVWSAFSEDTRYFDPSTAPFMFNYRVNDLDGLLAQLREAGVPVDDRIEDEGYGRFGWVMDPEGNRIELWEPPEGI